MPTNRGRRGETQGQKQFELTQQMIRQLRHIGRDTARLVMRQIGLNRDVLKELQRAGLSVTARTLSFLRWGWGVPWTRGKDCPRRDGG